MKLSKYILMGVSLLLSASAFAQKQADKKDVRAGNRDFKKEKYNLAEIDYRKALAQDSLSTAANYNLANTLYKMEDYQQASKFIEAAENSLSAEDGNADVFFNKGNVAIKEKNWNTAVEAFRQSLLLRPDDLEAKESYLYAKKMLEDEQNNQNQNQQDQDQNQDNQQNQNNQQDQDKKNQQDQNQDKQNQDNQDNQQNQGNQEQNPRMSQQAAEQMMQALSAKEKETREKARKAEALKMKSREKEKNW